MGNRSVTFSQEEVARLISIASSPRHGRTVTEQLDETLDALDGLLPHTLRFVYTLRPASADVHLSTMEARFANDYLTHYRFCDPMVPHAPRGENRVLCLSDVVTRGECDRSEFSEALRRGAIDHVAGIWTRLDEASQLFVVVARPRSMGDFVPKERSLFEVVLPALADCVPRGTRLADFGLSPMQLAVARLAAAGLGDREIARELEIGFASVRTHLARAFEKTGTHSRTALAALLLTLDGPRMC